MDLVELPCHPDVVTGHCWPRCPACQDEPAAPGRPGRPRGAEGDSDSPGGSAITRVEMRVEHRVEHLIKRVQTPVEMVVETPGNMIEPRVLGIMIPEAMAIPRWIMRMIVGAIMQVEPRIMQVQTSTETPAMTSIETPIPTEVTSTKLVGNGARNGIEETRPMPESWAAGRWARRGPGAGHGAVARR